jgi:hypothetical protein
MVGRQRSLGLSLRKFSPAATETVSRAISAKVSGVSVLQDLKVIALDRAIGHFLVHNPGTQLATGKNRLPQNPTIQPPGLDPVTDNSVLGFS